MPNAGEDFEFPGHIVHMSDRKSERQRADQYRIAALIGYGALLAHNKDGRYTFVLEALDKILFPKPPV